MITETAIKVMESGYVCDSCLGRQFAKLKPEIGNRERGGKIRGFLAIRDEAEKTRADRSNFSKGKHRCVVCEGAISMIPGMSKRALKKLEKMDFETFMVGVRMSDSLVMNEETLFEKTGMRYSEPIKAELNREFVKAISDNTKKRTDQERPDILIIFDMQENRVEIFSNPLFVYGEYKKFSRGLPQTSSPRYKNTVQDTIAKPLMDSTGSVSNVLHALGREDMEARCLVWRPFILELKQPIRRKIRFSDEIKRINSGTSVKVRKLRLSDREEVASLKSKRPYKVYRLVADFEAKVEAPGRLAKIKGTIKQKTPRRVLRSKPDKTKNKKVKSIKWKRINNKRYQMEITTESGLYLKELVSGDSGRTVPSISGVLGNQAKIREFDLIGIKG